MRDGRKRDVEEHVQNISAILREAERAGGVSDAESSANEGEEWTGLPDTPAEETVDHEEEYIDEDKYTSVTVESVSISRDGLHKPEQEPPEPDEKEMERRAAEALAAKPKVARTQKKAPKFRYQTKVERQITRKKEKIKKVKGRA
jgi:ribosomal RNA-processing protein 17